MTTENNNTIKNFQQKVWTACAIAALFVVVIWLFKATFNVLLLILAGILIAAYFRGLSGLIHRNIKLPENASLAISVIGSIVLLGLFFWLAGAKISEQANEMSDTLPATINTFKSQLRQNPLGQKALDYISSRHATQKETTVVRQFFRSTFGALGDIYVVLFIGIFFTVSPKTYVNGFLKLIPPKAKPQAHDILNHLGATLTKWLKGKIFAMFVVAVLTYIALIILGMPLALILALIAGALNFIPNFGPLIAMIPAALIGLTQSTQTALIVIAVYVAIQILESNFITPQVQKKLISIPPALIIIAQLFMGMLTGGWGLLLATPVAAILIVVLQDTYIKKQES